MAESSRLMRWLVTALPLTLASAGVGVCGQPEAGAPEAGFAPSAMLTTADNVDVNLRKLAGDKIAVIHLLYTRCEACGSGMETLKEIQNELASEGRLGEEVVILSITLDPERDTHAVLKEFAESNEVKPGWTFLTGSDAEIRKLRDQLEPPPLDLSEEEREADRTLQHSGILQIINGATGKRTSISVKARPERILDLISRVKSPEP